MTITPHAYQLKAAGQADWLCEEPFGGILVGDGMGLGKTLTSIIAMYLRRDEPGMSLVLCPASLCAQWVETIEKSWSEVRMGAPYSDNFIISSIIGPWHEGVPSS